MSAPKRVSEMSDAEIREMCGATNEDRPCSRVGLHNCGGDWLNHDRSGHPVSTHPTYRGRMKDGTGVTGVTPDPYAFAAAKFRAGWRELTITRNGVEVGGISRHPDTGRRTWWAETTDRGTL